MTISYDIVWYRMIRVHFKYITEGFLYLKLFITRLKCRLFVYRLKQKSSTIIPYDLLLSNPITESHVFPNRTGTDRTVLIRSAITEIRCSTPEYGGHQFHTVSMSAEQFSRNSVSMSPQLFTVYSWPCPRRRLVYAGWPLGVHVTSMIWSPVFI